MDEIERLGDTVYAWAMDNGANEDEANEFTDTIQANARALMQNLDTSKLADE